MPLGDAERMANTGVREDLSFGTVRVKELVLEDLIALGGELTQLLGTMDLGTDMSGGGLAWLGVAMRDPATMKAIKSVAAAATGEEVSKFDRLPATDWMKLVRSFKNVMDWEEIRSLFMEIVPEETLARFKRSMTDQHSPNSSTNLQASTSGPAK